MNKSVFYRDVLIVCLNQLVIAILDNQHICSRYFCIKLFYEHQSSIYYFVKQFIMHQNSRYPRILQTHTPNTCNIIRTNWQCYDTVPSTWSQLMHLIQRLHRVVCIRLRVFIHDLDDRLLIFSTDVVRLSQLMWMIYRYYDAVM